MGLGWVLEALHSSGVCGEGAQGLCTHQVCAGGGAQGLCTHQACTHQVCGGRGGRAKGVEELCTHQACGDDVVEHALKPVLAPDLADRWVGWVVCQQGWNMRDERDTCKATAQRAGGKMGKEGREGRGGRQGPLQEEK